MPFDSSHSGYGHDNSMYAFMVNGVFMLFLAAAGFFGALVQVRDLDFHGVRISDMLDHVLSECP